MDCDGDVDDDCDVDVGDGERDFLLFFLRLRFLRFLFGVLLVFTLL